jgi:biopolymer transport protein ExbD
VAYRPSKRRRHSILSEDINLTPILNIFMIIIPFLLLTAVFAKTSIIDIYLPQEVEGAKDDKSPQTAKVLTIKVTEKGFELGGIGEGMLIPRIEGNLNFNQLSAELLKLKHKHPDKEEVVLLFDPNTPYDLIVNIMDATRETTEVIEGKGVKRLLFPLVSLGENI